MATMTEDQIRQAKAMVLLELHEAKTRDVNARAKWDEACSAIKVLAANLWPLPVSWPATRGAIRDAGHFLDSSVLFALADECEAATVELVEAQQRVAEFGIVEG